MPIKSWKNDLVRFSVEFGPKSLFDRVEYKMKDIHTLHLSGPHYQQRLKERKIPEEVINSIENFNVEQWRVVTAEVRADRGKFYNSTWEYVYNGKKYWITIGLGECVSTIVEKTSSGVGKCVKNGEIYNFVEQVNRELMIADVEDYDN